LVDRARLLGMPVSPVATGRDEARDDPSRWYRECAFGEQRSAPSPRSVGQPLRVVDLSALWAGPLCSHLLALAGADVIKVASSRRPDGARNGPAAFFDLMHGGKRSVALDLSTVDGHSALLRLLRSTDIVVESSRPRALAQMGIDAVRLVETIPGLVWISITGHGRSEPEAGWVAFGDDAAAAGGACVAAGSMESPIFCADAVADPLTGIHAALIAMASHQTGRARLVDVSLVGVTRHVLFADGDLPGRCDIEVRRCATHGADDEGTGWEIRAGDWRQPVLRPRARVAAQPAAALGADTLDVLAGISTREPR
jgi:hypothetical protein